MAEAALAELSIEEAANSLVEAPDAVPATYEPGRLEESTPEPSPSRGGLSLEEAANLIAEDLPASAARSGKTVAVHNGMALTLDQLVQCFNEGLAWKELSVDVHTRYEDIAQAARNLWTGAGAVAELLGTIFPKPSASLAQADPVAYQQAKVVHETVHQAALEVVLYAQSIAQQHGDAALAQIPRDKIAVEAACFREAFPQSADPKWCEQFGERITKAAEFCGYHASELNAVVDHRALKVLDLAAKALERQGGASRPSAQPAQPAKRPGLRLATSREDRLTRDEAMLIDFD